MCLLVKVMAKKLPRGGNSVSARGSGFASWGMGDLCLCTCFRVCSWEALGMVSFRVVSSTVVSGSIGLRLRAVQELQFSRVEEQQTGRATQTTATSAFVNNVRVE